MIVQFMHLVGNYYSELSVLSWSLSELLFLCTSVVVELGQGKPTRHQKTTRYLLWLGQRPSSSLYVPASWGSDTGTALPYTHSSCYWDPRHAERSTLLLAMAHSSAQAALHGGRARGLRKGVIIHCSVGLRYNTHKHACTHRAQTFAWL